MKRSLTQKLGLLGVVSFLSYTAAVVFAPLTYPGYIPNLYLPDEPDYQIGKYGRMRRSYLKAHRPVLYANYLTSGTLHRHLAEIDQACNERMEIIVSAMVKQEGVTEALKAADQMEWVRRMNSIRSRAEEIVLTELVYE